MTHRPFLRWIEITRIIADIGFYSSSTLCFLFIALTLYGIKRSFGMYKYLMVSFSSVGIVWASIEFVLYPLVHSYNVGFFFYSTSHPLGLGKDAVTWILKTYTATYGMTISMLAVQFVYRYWAVFYVHKLCYFKGWWLLVVVMYIVLTGIAYLLSLFYIDVEDEFSQNYMREEIFRCYGLNISEVSGVTMIAYNSDGSLRLRNLARTIAMTTVILVQYIIIIYCATQMYLKMEEKLEVVSASIKKLHKQFFKTLILQITFPSALLFTPIIIIILIPYFDIKVSLPTGMFICALTLYPAMDSLFVMLIVTDYRRCVKGICKIIENWGGKSKLCFCGLESYSWEVRPRR